MHPSTPTVAEKNGALLRPPFPQCAARSFAAHGTLCVCVCLCNKDPDRRSCDAFCLDFCCFRSRRRLTDLSRHLALCSTSLALERDLLDRFAVLSEQIELMLPPSLAFTEPGMNLGPIKRNCGCARGCFNRMHVC